MQKKFLRLLSVITLIMSCPVFASASGSDTMSIEQQTAPGISCPIITPGNDAGKMFVEFSKIALNNKKLIPFSVQRKVDSVNWEIIFSTMISVKTPAENPTIKEKNIYPNSCIYHVKVGQEKMLIVMHKATY